MKSKILILVLAVGLTAQSKASYINIDDSDVNNITLTAGDFEGGFYVGATLLTIGLGNSGSITIVDGGFGQTFTGMWIDLGQTPVAPINVYFGAGGTVLSGFDGSSWTGGGLGQISGGFVGYSGASLFPGSNLLPQDGHTEVGGLPFLSWSFRTENPNSVPDTTSTLALLSVSFIGLTALRRRFGA
jgi:hypothetical protein